MDLDLLQQVETVYGLSEIVHVAPVEKGVLSANWVLYTGESKLFLKRYRFEDESRIREIHAVKHFFADSGIPIILPISTRKGGSYMSHGGRWFALFPFIAERELERGHLSDTAVTSMGSMLAYIHKAGAKSSVPIEKSFNYWDKAVFLHKSETFLAHIEALESKTEFDEMALRDLRGKLELIQTIDAVPADFGLQADHLLHGDFLNHNLFFTEQDNVSHVFDLEKCLYGPRAYELVRSFLYSIADGDWNNEIARRIRIYIKAYRNVYAISNEEIANGLELYYVKSLYNVWIQHEHYVLGNTRPDQFLAPDMARTEFLSMHRQQVLAEICK